MLLRFESPLPIMSKCLIVVLRLAALGVLVLGVHFLLHPDAYSVIDANSLSQRIQRGCLYLLWVWGLAWHIPLTISKARLGWRQNNAHYGMETLYRLLGFGMCVFAVAQWHTTLISSLYALAYFLCAWQLLHHASDFNQQNQPVSESPPQTYLPLTLATLLLLAKLWM